MKTMALKSKELILCLMLAFSFGLTGCGSKVLTEGEVLDLPIDVMEGSFAFNTHDPCEAVGSCDYVFVGRVISYDGVRYLYPIKDVGCPYTDYSVQVVENVKGTLITSKPIKIVKDGGVAQNGKEVYLYERDEMPESGKSYIFLGYAQPDGSIQISGPESNVLISEDSVIEKYKNAFKNEKKVDNTRERYHSIYEE